jgi:hypothetical protein
MSPWHSKWHILHLLIRVKINMISNGIWPLLTNAKCVILNVTDSNLKDKKCSTNFSIHSTKEKKIVRKPPKCIVFPNQINRDKTVKSSEKLKIRCVKKFWKKNLTLENYFLAGFEPTSHQNLKNFNRRQLCFYWVLKALVHLFFIFSEKWCLNCTFTDWSKDEPIQNEMSPTN